MAASSSPALACTEPCVNCRKVIGCAVPKPIWVSPSPDPIDCVTRSRKLNELALNPVVFRFARLLPTTSTAVDMALSAESADENEPGMESPYFTFWVSVCGGAASFSRSEEHTSELQ